MDVMEISELKAEIREIDSEISSLKDRKLRRLRQVFKEGNVISVMHASGHEHLMKVRFVTFDGKVRAKNLRTGKERSVYVGDIKR